MDKPKIKKISPTRTSQNTNVGNSGIGGPTRQLGESVVLDQLCHLSDAVTRLSIRSQTTNTLLSSVLELQQNMLDETRKSNRILGDVKDSLVDMKKELKDSNENLQFIGSEIDKMEDITRDMEEISKKHNTNVDSVLNALIILLQGEDAVEKIRQKANCVEN